LGCCLSLGLQLPQADLQQLHRPEQWRQLRSMRLQLGLLLELAVAGCLQHPLLLLLLLSVALLLLRLF
jgi:hypothetical protein